MVAAERPGPCAFHADGVDLVDEDDAGRALLGFREHVPHARGAHAHEHLLEVATGNREEGHPRLARDRTRQKRLARAGRTDEQHAFRNPRADLAEFLGLFQELHDFLHFALGLVHARHVGERDALALLLAGEHLGARLAHAENAAARAPGAPPHEPVEQGEKPEEEEQLRHERRKRALPRLDAHVQPPPEQIRHQRVVLPRHQRHAKRNLRRLARRGGRLPLAGRDGRRFGRLGGRQQMSRQIGFARVAVQDARDGVGDLVVGEGRVEFMLRQDARFGPVGVQPVHREEYEGNQCDYKPRSPRVIRLLNHAFYYTISRAEFGDCFSKSQANL